MSAFPSWRSPPFDWSSLLSPNPCSRFDRLPERGVVTAVALGAEATVVRIIFAVAASAGVGGEDASFHRLLMAVVAVQFLVRAIQRKLRPFIVVVIPELPVPRRMAGLALRTQPSLMHVFLLVATDAVQRRVFEEQGCVACLAIDEVMLPAERESRGVVVEPDLLPRFLTMAGLAPCSLLLLMFVVLLVAGVTVGCVPVLIEMAFVAAVACQADMLSSQRIFRVAVMIKREVLPALFDMTIPAAFPV